jgi:hypothetical protein
MRTSWLTDPAPDHLAARTGLARFHVESVPDRTGLHLILEEYAAAQADGTQLALVAGPPEVQRVFDLTGLGAQLPFSDVADLKSGAAWA